MDLHRSLALLWRWLAAACLAVIAAVHLDIAPAHLREAPYAGALFIALSAAAMLCAVLLVTTNHQLVWAATAAVATGALVAYFLSRSIALPMLADDVGDWLNPLGIIAVVSETIVVIATTRGYRTVTGTERLYTVVPANPISPPG